MALGFNLEESTSTGEILPIVKFDSKAGDWRLQNRVQDTAGQWIKQESEMSIPIKFVMDMENLEVGWLGFVSGKPDFNVVKVGQPIPDKPEKEDSKGEAVEFKRAFRVRVASKEIGLREFSHSAKTVMRALDELHNVFEATKAQHPGQVPIIEITGNETVKISTQQGELRFKAPQWNISGWVDKPDMLTGSAPEPVAPAPTPAAQSDDDLF